MKTKLTLHDSYKFQYVKTYPESIIHMIHSPKRFSKRYVKDMYKNSKLYKNCSITTYFIFLWKEKNYEAF